jgi:hypothetical protein
MHFLLAQPSCPPLVLEGLKSEDGRSDSQLLVKKLRQSPALVWDDLGNVNKSVSSVEVGLGSTNNSPTAFQS